MTAFDTPHHIHVGNYTAMHDTRSTWRGGEEPVNPRPWARVLARCHGHELVMNRRGEFYDRARPHSMEYLGRARSDRDAASKWRNHLMALGVHVEDGMEVIDG